MSESAKMFYYVLRTPEQPIRAQGLLYSSDTSIFTRLKIAYCVNGTSVICMPANNATNSTPNQEELSNRGRIFLFVENTPDTSSISL
jgi:hypothetical protein